MSQERTARVTALFHRAIELPTDKRAAFLDAACGGDEALRAEVASLVTHHSSSTIFHIQNEAEPRPPIHFTRLASKPSRRSGWSGPTGRRRIAAVAFAVGLALSAAGFVVYRTVEAQLRADIKSRLNLVLETNTSSLVGWIDTWKNEVERWAENPEVRAQVEQLVALTRGADTTGSELRRTAAHRTLSSVLSPLVSRPGVRGVNVVNREQLLVFFGDNGGMNSAYRVSEEGASTAASVFLGKTQIVAPFPSGRNVVDLGNKGARQLGTPTMIVAAPVRDDRGNVIAILVLRFDSEPEFTRRLRVASAGPNTDTYAFDQRGVMVSNSRYDSELKALGLIPNTREAASLLRLALRDPGGNLTGGFVTTEPQSAWPLTKMARMATMGQAGLDLDGYRDFRGVRVVGAWQWLADYHIGIATEIPYDDAYAALAVFHRGFGFLIGVTALLAVFGFISSLSIHRLRSEVRKARRFGQYRLEEVIGEGGMARVYRAKHATLQRPVAIKLLKGDALGANDVARFEREVKLVSQLSHKNTIQIFDYGQADDGTVFYVMELVPGITLSQLVDIAGALPAGRVISILRQVCGSLSEAHALGIVHRDIKPANIMICSRTDGADIVKVLDFGLARTLAIASAAVTRKEILGGTPAYIAPERIQHPTSLDTRSDIYGLGAVAFYLLTGRETVEGSTPQEILLRTIQANLPRPSTLATSVPPELDHLVSSCLASNPEERPQSVSAILDVLDTLGTTHTWTDDDAHDWWQHYWARA